MSWAISNKPTFQGPRYANAQDRGQQTQRPRQEGRPPSTHSLQCGERLALGRSSKSTVKRPAGPKGVPYQLGAVIYLNSKRRRLEYINVSNFILFILQWNSLFKQNLKQNPVYNMSKSGSDLA